MYTRWPVILVAALLSGCVSSRVQQGGTPGAARAASGIYLAPFVNATANPEAGSAVTEIAATSMMAHGLPVIQSERLRSQADELIGAGKQHQMIDVARASGASHALFGTIHEYRFKSDLDGAPTVGMTTRLVDVYSGATVWQGTTSKSGYYYGSLSKTTQTAMDNLVEQMAGNGRVKSSRRKKSQPSPYAATYGGSYGDVNYNQPRFSQPTVSSPTFGQPTVTSPAIGQPAISATAPNLAYQQSPPVLPGYDANAGYQTPSVNYQPPSSSISQSYAATAPQEKRSWWSKVFSTKRGMPGTEPFRWTNRPRVTSGLEYEQIKRRGDSTTSPWPVAPATPPVDINVSSSPYNSYNTATANTYTAPPIFPSPSTTTTTATVATDHFNAQWQPSGTVNVPAPAATVTTTAPSLPAPTASTTSLPSSGWTPSNY